MERENTYPYPLRPSEFVLRKNTTEGAVETALLTEADRESLLTYEAGLFDRLVAAKKGKSGEHSIYKEAFQSDSGKRLFALVYLDPRSHVDRTGVTDEDNPDTDKTDWDKEFGRLQKISQGAEMFNEYIQDFPELRKILSIDIELLLQDVNLDDVPKGLRKRVNEFSSNFARDQFRESFIEAKGYLPNVHNPQRITKSIHTESAKAREIRLRRLKQGLKEEKSTAEKEVIRKLYLQAINVLLAQGYDYSTLEGRTNPSRSLEKVDHFLHGVGPEIESDGLFESLPLGIRNYVERSLVQNEESVVSEKYNAHEVNAEALKRIAQLGLNYYGWDNWKPVLKKTGSTAVSYKRVTKTGEVRIVEGSTRGLVTALTTMAHEIEGHILRVENQRKNSGSSLKLMEDISVSRSDVLSEAAAMDIESRTKMHIGGTSRKPEPYHYLSAAARELGADFKQIFKANLEVRAYREYGLYIEDLLNDREKYDKVFDYVYPRVLRVFRRNTPLSDTSGALTTSAELDYIEQYLIGNATEKNKKIMYQSGVDLYSADQLISLGLLDVNSIREPDGYFFNTLWPQLKEHIDTGKTVSEAISLVENSQQKTP